MRSGRLSRPAVDSPALKSNLDDVIPKGCERLANHFFISKGVIGFRGIEERHAALEGALNEFDCLLRVGGRSILPLLTNAAKPAFPSNVPWLG